MNFETEIELLKKSVLLDKEQNVLNQKQILKRIKKIENKQEDLEYRIDTLESKIWRWSSVVEDAYKKKRNEEAMKLRKEAAEEGKNYFL